jgi:lipoprotein NlpI
LRPQDSFKSSDSRPARYDEAIRLGPSSIIAVAKVLRLYLARARSQPEAGVAELQSNAAVLKQTDWPAPVVALSLGRKSAAETLATANKPGERCEAQFYVGDWYLLHGAKTAARPALQAAADTCPKSFDEYQLAQFELKQFGR